MILRRKTAKERSEHKRGIARVMAFLGVVSVISVGVSLRYARAEVLDKSVMVGRQMLELANADKDRSEVSRVLLNGQPLYMSSALSDDDVSTVLGRYKKHCDDNRAQSTELWKKLAENNANEQKVDPSAPGAQMAESGGTLRGGDDNEGTVLCFVRSPESKPTLNEAFETLVDTGELNAVGQVRYAYAKKSEGGRTHILSVWTNEKFNVKEFLPEGDRDVPGFDFAEVPRPEESTRIFSIHMEGAPYGVNIYESKVSPEKTVEAFDKQLVKTGWLALDLESVAKRSNPSLKNATGRLYEKDGAVLTLVSKVDDGSTVTALGIAGTSDGERESRR